MSDVFGSALAGERTLGGVALQATVLLLLVFAAHAALGRRRALTRSALWNACLVGLLLLPAAGFGFPRLSVPVPRLTTPQAVAPPPDRVEAVPPIVPTSVDAAPILGIADRRTAPIGEVLPARLPEEPALQPPATEGWNLTRLVPIAYFAVAAILTMKLLVALLAVHRLRRRCRPFGEAPWSASLEHWRVRLGIGRPVALLTSDRISVPVVVGWLRPAIILPTSLVEAKGQPLADAVLLHELAHVRRGDYGWNLVRKAVQVLYWPHPLVWPLGRILGSVREQACDDLCIHALGGASQYRAALLEVASGLVRRPEPSLGMAMARGNLLGRRLAWVDRSQGSPRCLLRWPSRLTLAATILGISGLVGMVELVQATASAIRLPDEPMAPVATDEKQTLSPKAVAPTDTPKAPAADAIEVFVVAKDTGKPIADAAIRATLDFRDVLLKTDRDGKATIDRSGVLFRSSFNFDVWAEGYVQQRYFFSDEDPKSEKIPARFTVELVGQVAC